MPVIGADIVNYIIYCETRSITRPAFTVGIPGNITNKYNKIGEKIAGAWARKFKHDKQDIYDYLRKRVIRETKKYYKEGKNE